MTKKPRMKTARLAVRTALSRVAFRGSSYSAVLEDEDAREYALLAGPTRQYDTWAEAARAALKMADRRGIYVANRVLIERKLASLADNHGTPGRDADGEPGNVSE